MERGDISNLIYYYKELIEEWLHEDVGECVTRWAYYRDFEDLPYNIRDGIKLMEKYGHPFDWDTKLFKTIEPGDMS